MSTNVIEPVKKPIKEFQTKEEFDLYYSKHKEEMEAATTHMLNKLYTIKNYHITRKKGIEGLCLKKWEGSRYLKDSDMSKLDRAVTISERVEEVERHFTEQLKVCFQRLNMLMKRTDDMDEDISLLRNDVEADRPQPTIPKEVELIPKLSNDVQQLYKRLDYYQNQLNCIIEFLKSNGSTGLPSFK
jgi:hypothetical protein